jgi:hypothetical protein
MAKILHERSQGNQLKKAIAAAIFFDWQFLPFYGIVGIGGSLWLR